MRALCPDPLVAPPCADASSGVAKAEEQLGTAMRELEAARGERYNIERELERLRCVRPTLCCTEERIQPAQ